MDGYECGNCGTKFSRINNLQNHMLSEKGCEINKNIYNKQCFKKS